MFGRWAREFVVSFGAEIVAVVRLGVLGHAGYVAAVLQVMSAMPLRAVLLLSILLHDILLCAMLLPTTLLRAVLLFACLRGTDNAHLGTASSQLPSSLPSTLRQSTGPFPLSFFPLLLFLYIAVRTTCLLPAYDRPALTCGMQLHSTDLRYDATSF
eukprot:1959844-Rhodomonas_salina.3